MQFYSLIYSFAGHDIRAPILDHTWWRIVPHAIVVRLQLMPHATCKGLVPRRTFHNLARRDWLGLGGSVDMLGMSGLRSA